LSQYHQLPATITRSMTGGGDRAERKLLRDGQYSKRLIQLLAIRDMVADRADLGREAQFDEGYRALTGVQEHAPDVVAEVLSGPQVGAWAAWCLRRLGRGEADDNTPLWVHLAHLGSIAAAAAIRSGTSLKVRVPARTGVVTLPSVGRATVQRADDWALLECTVGTGGVLLDGAAPVRWTPVRWLRTTAGGTKLEVQLDDVDPYWQVFGLPLRDRLDNEEFERWQGRLAATWNILAERHAHRLDTMAAAVRSLVPVEQAGRFGRVSASSADAPGAIALTEPTNPTRLAATLIHESQHYRLGALHDLLPLYHPSPRTLLYSPWRNDPRPLSGVLHGIQAFLGVADFWLREPTDPIADLEYARHAGQLRVATDVLAGSDGLTPFGRALADSLRTAIAALPTDVGTAEVRRLAGDLVAEHQAGWRLRNVVPDEDDVHAVMREWQAGGPLLPKVNPGQVVPGEPGGDNPLTRLAMAWLADPAEVRALTGSPVEFTTRFPGARTADLHLITGDYSTARAETLSKIEAGTATGRDWATLTAAHAGLCADPSRSPLVRHPELVRAAHTRLAPPPATTLDGLLSHYEAGTSTSDSMRR
jgi:HEXXH motif-containing protein